LFSKSELSNNNNQARIRVKDIGAIAKLLHKSKSFTGMKVKRAGIEEEGRKKICAFFYLFAKPYLA